MGSDDILTLTIEHDEETETLEVPAGLIDMLAEDDEAAPEVVGDIALFGLAGRVHGAVHHAEGEPDEALEAVEATTMDLFEERFGMTYGEATGHSH